LDKIENCTTTGNKLAERKHRVQKLGIWFPTQNISRATGRFVFVSDAAKFAAEIFWKIRYKLFK
jgi:hypothetical protein